MITIPKLKKYEADGLVHGSRHPSLPLTVWCYTRKAQHERVWDEVTTGARGLVMHDDGHVVGRGLSKFFAADDPLAKISPLDTFGIFDKMDGTLIHVTEYEGELLIWTKGSFVGPHVEAARPYLTGWRPNPDTTTLFEGIFGFNRVVVDYGQFQGLVLLGEVVHSSGKDWNHPMDVADDTGWSGEVVVERNITLDYIRTICSDPENGEGREGFVVVYHRPNAPANRVKVKFEWYLQLHKLLSNLTPRRIHEAYLDSLRQDEGAALWEAFLAQIPDEMNSDVQNIVEALLAHCRGLYEAAEAAVSAASEITERRDIAEEFDKLDPSVKAIAWLLLDGRSEDAWLLAARSYPSDVHPLDAAPLAQPSDAVSDSE
jgi:RNA ligase